MMNFVIDDFNALRAALQTMCVRLTGENLSEETVFSSKLVANELLSNVLQHGGGRAYFSAERQGDELKLTVRGERAYRPPERSVPAEVFAERGRGLFLVDSYCDRRDYTDAEGVRVFLKISYREKSGR